MNTREIVTCEYVFRESSEEKKSKNSESRKGLGLKKSWIVCLLLAFVITSGVLFAQASKTDVNGALAEKPANAGSAVASTQTLAALIYQASTQPSNMKELSNKLSVNKYFASIMESGKEDTEGSSELVGDSEIIGSLGFMSGIFDSYRQDDPVLPSYLKLTYNRNFCMKLTPEEIDTLCRLVEAEAPAEDIFGKILVANVVLNRVLSSGMANTVTGVIFQRFGNAVQFASTANKTYWNSIVVTDTTREAVARALAGEDYSNGALFFFAWKKHPELTPTTGWTKLYKYCFKHGGHAFYK